MISHKIKNIAYSKWLIKTIPLLLIILNLIIKSLYLNENSIGFDEPFSIYHAQLDISTIIEQMSKGNNPPLYEIFLHFWIKLFGISPLSVRTPSLLFSSLIALFIYKIGRSFYSIWLGILASLLFTFSNYHLIFAHEARVYPLFALLTVISMFYFLKAINEQNTYASYIKLLLVNTLLCYSHYFGFFIILIQSIIIFTDKKLLVNQLKIYSKYFFVLLILYIPNIKTLFSRFMESSKGTWVSKPTGLSNLYDMLSIFANKPVLNIIILLLFVLFILKFIFKYKDIKVSLTSKTIILWFLLPYIIMFFVSYKIPMFLDRYLIFITIGYYILIALSINYIYKTKLYKAIFSMILIIGFLFTFNPYHNNKRPIEAIIDKTKEIRKINSNSIIIISPKHFVYNYSYYFDKNIFKTKFKNNPIDSLANSLEKQDIYAINNIEELNLNKKKKIIFLDAAADFSNPQNHILSTLKKNFTLKNTYRYNGIYSIYFFEFPGA